MGNSVEPRIQEIAMKKPMPTYSFPRGTSQTPDQTKRKYDRFQIVAALVIVLIVGGYFAWQFLGR